MRLLYFSRDYTTHDHRFLTALAETGHTVFYLRLEQRGHQLEDRPLPPGIEQIHWAGGRSPARFIDGLSLLGDLKRVIREVKPDLIQAGPLQRSAFLVALAGFRPLLSMSWGYDLIFDASRNVFWRWATRYTLKRSAMMLGDCEAIRKLAVSFGLPEERALIFPWGIDLEHFSPSPDFRPPSRAFTLLSTRGWEPIYGVEIIAQSFVQAAKNIPELRLVMLGNGSQAARLRQIFIAGGVSERVTFPGQISNSDLPRYYQMADLYLSASHSDGTSISLLEAMACGVPAVTSDIPGNQEWVIPGENGWLFTDGDPNDLTRTILAAVGQRDRLPAMGRAARQVTEQRANWKQNIPRLFQAYHTILQTT